MNKVLKTIGYLLVGTVFGLYGFIVCFFNGSFVTIGEEAVNGIKKPKKKENKKSKGKIVNYSDKTRKGEKVEWTLPK